MEQKWVVKVAPMPRNRNREVRVIVAASVEAPGPIHAESTPRGSLQFRGRQAAASPKHA